MPSSAARSATASARQVFPMPGSPAMSTRRPCRPVASRSAPSISISSRARPTSDLDPPFFPSSEPPAPVSVTGQGPLPKSTLKRATGQPALTLSEGSASVTVRLEMDEHPERSGCWTAMVAISPIRRCWAVWLRGYYPFLRWLVNRRVIPLPIKSLIKLSMIGFARWSVFDRIPASGDGEGLKRLRTPYLLFETNFDGDSDRYLESFCLVLPWGMRGNWWGAYHVPNVRKVSRFVDYVNRHKVPIAYYYSAYLEASTKRIRYARALMREIADFNRQTAYESSDGFQRAYFVLLEKVQRIQRLGPESPPTRNTEALTVMTRVQDSHLQPLKSELDQLRAEP